MIFEALLLLLRADNRPGNRYVLWRKLHACAIFVFVEELTLEANEIYQILAKLNFSHTVTSITQFCREEDGSPYDVWKIETDNITAVLKKTSVEERTTCEAFFPYGGCGILTIYGFTEHDGETYMLMEFFEGETMSHSTREKLILALDALIQTQAKFWGSIDLADAGWTFDKRHAARKKRLAYMEDLSDAYEAYLEADRSVPRTLCNDDLLPFNVLVNADRAVIIDWEFAGILPYPCALARLLAFGEENTDFMFQMSLADKEFAVQYYYDHLIRSKGISWDEFIQTMKLFFFKEYSEWVYFARSSNDFTKPEYQKYYAKCKILANSLGLYKEETR